MGRLTKRSNKTSHENGVCCTHFMSKECVQFGGECAWGCKWEEAAWGKLADYEDAEEQGLLLRLPCKAGDAVYSCVCGMIVRDFVHSFSTDVNGLWAINLYGGIIGLFGLSVFTTQEEAEQALARMEGEDD